jgi:hypothetical protein
VVLNDLKAAHRHAMRLVWQTIPLMRGEDLRHFSCVHPDLTYYAARTAWPAMVAVVRDADRAAIGLHRSYLARDGSGEAPVPKSKVSRPLAVTRKGRRLGSGLLCPRGF